MPSLQLPSNQLVTIPFCALGTPTTDFVLPPIIGSGSSSIQTQEYGIPPKQAQNPAFGGLPVKRVETNGVLQFYSNVLYFINQGGQFTFDATQSTAIGGYSEGAVLFNFPTNSYVISLIDNNTFNFVTTPSYIDGTHWATLNSLVYPDITDTGGLVSIIGASGLKVDKTASFLADTLGPKITLLRNTNTLPNTYTCFIDAENTVGNIPGQTKGAIWALDGGSAVPALAGAYNGTTRFYLVNATPGDLDPAVHTHALAMLGDIIYGIPSVPFSFPNGTEIRVNDTTIFPTVNGISLSGHYPGSVGTPYSPGNTAIDMNLITEGVIVAARGYSNFGSATGGLTAGILATVEFDGTFLKLVVNNTTAGDLVADIHFSVEI